MQQLRVLIAYPLQIKIISTSADNLVILIYCKFLLNCLKISLLPQHMVRENNENL